MDQLFAHNTIVGSFFDVLHQDPVDPAMQNPSVFCRVGATESRSAILATLSTSYSLAEKENLARDLSGLISTPVQLFVLDFSHVEKFDINAVSVLVNFLAEVAGREKELILYRPPGFLVDTLKTVNLASLFTMAEDEEDLLLALPDN